MLDRRLAGSGDERFVTFVDLVELMAIRAFRRYVTLDSIRQGVQRARKRHGVDHPLAMRHRTLVYGGELVIELGAGEYEQLSGRHAGNRMLQPIVETYALRLDFGADDLACRYRAYVYKDVEIILDPKVAFGSAYVRACGMTAEALVEAVRVEGGVREAAVACGVDQVCVEAACEFIDSLYYRSPA